jgi:hypothetical protein
MWGKYSYKRLLMGISGSPDIFQSKMSELIKSNCTNLSPLEQAKLLEVLTEFEDLFDGTLGDWDTEPVSFKLKEGAKPYHGRAFPIPQVHKKTIMNEIKRLIEIGVLEWQLSPEWAAP